MRGVPECHYRGLEYLDRLQNLGELLFLFGAHDLPVVYALIHAGLMILLHSSRFRL